MNHHQRRLKAYLSSTCGASADDLCQFLGVTPSTLSRQMRFCDDWVIRWGAARSTRYYAARKILRNEYRWPVYRITDTGEMVEGGVLTSLFPNHWHFEGSKELSLFNKGSFKQGIYPGLPWFLEDMRPQGFLGRLFVKEYATQLRVGTDARMWGPEDLLSVLLSYGVDFPGNLIIGEDTAKRYQHQRHENKQLPLLENRPTFYPDCAQSVLLGYSDGSSTGGEQQKFTSVLSGNGEIRHVIVKFSPLLNTSTGRRWANLLICEHLVSKILIENKIPAAHTEIIEAGGRIFLESTRFDRCGQHGRIGLYSCLNFDAAYYGSLDNWHLFSDRLDADQWLPQEDIRLLRVLYAFGTMIGNSDMHFGNISFLQERSGALRLAPCYDMLPMLYAPSTHGEVIDRDFSVVPPSPAGYESWKHAFPIAKYFWDCVQSHPLIDSPFKKLTEGNSQKIQEVMKGRWAE